MPLAVRGAALFSRAAALALVLPPPRLTTRASAAMLCLPRGGGDDQPGEEWAPDASGASSLTKGTVYIVGTPIGNLDDLTLRAARTLREVDVVASEDTRRTAVLLRHLGASPKKQLSHHEHNARAASARVVELARGGATVAVVSDAGTPGISDPGALLAAECAAAGVPLVPVPGACAAIAALSISGFAAAGFRFGGFLPRAGRGRREALAALVADERAAVLYESAPGGGPVRIRGVAAASGVASELAAKGAGERRCLAARELTKLHEETARGTVSELAARYAAAQDEAGKLRGEFTIVLAPLAEEEVAARASEARDAAQDEARDQLRERLATGQPLSRAVREVAAAVGARRGAVYQIALELKDGGQE